MAKKQRKKKKAALPAPAAQRPREFLDLIDRLAAQYGVDMDPVELRRRAVKWDMRVPNRTPRGARQFLASLQIS